MSVNACGSKSVFFRSLLGSSSGLMLWLSVVLHSAIALSPLKKAPVPSAQTVLESPPAITVSRLPEPSPAAVPDSAEAQSTTPQPIEPQLAVSQLVMPQPVTPVAPDPVPPPVVAALPSDIAVETVPVENTAPENMPIETVPVENTAPETVPVENTVPIENTAPENEGNDQSLHQSNEAKVADMAVVWEGFLVGLQSGLSEFSLQEILNFFGQPGQEELFFEANQQPKFSVVSYHLLEAKTPQQVFEEIVNPGLNDQKGFEVEAYGEFAGGPVYEVVQGEIVHYLNIVPLNERSGSVLIVCDGECPS